ncbi:MAG: carboxypeptidase regulatory-like domain-containing protein [Planctomycetes bacterium]|nr:carboxypeptidase regulatory-like domain-containing protein [Planctomycetota bacterium]
MTQNRTLLLLLCALLFGGAGAWLAFSSGADGDNPEGDRLACAPDPDDNVAPLEGEVGEDAPAATPGTDEPLPLEADTSIKPGDATATGDATKTGGKAQTGGSNSGGPNNGSPPNRSNPGSNNTNPAPKKPAKRKLTPQEREEARRQSTGRPALRNTLSRTPGRAGSAGTLKKSPEQEKWEEQWYDEGFNPPEMTPTPVHGKIMSQEAREGLAKATVALISFFPLDGVAGGPLLPVITEFETDDNGLFGGDIPASKLAPLNYPPVALAVTWEGHRIVAGMPITTLDVGQQNEFGIFWAPEQPFTLDVDATQFTGAPQAFATGELDPQRWHSAKRLETLAYFPAADVATEDPKEGEEGPPQGHATVIGTWDGKDKPYITLVNGEGLFQTRRPSNATTASNNSNGKNLPAPFATLVFENDALTPITGQVIDADGAGIAGAAVTTVGGDLSRTVISDAAGWFTFTDPPEKTNALKVVHDDYVENQVGPVQPGDSNVVITLGTRRPRIQLHVIDRITQIPIGDLSVQVIGLYPWGKNAGKPMPEAFTQLTSTDGNFLLEWEFAIKSITLEKLGYFPKTLQDPAAIQEAEGIIEVELGPSRKLEVIPRDYTAVERDDRWFKDPNNGEGIYTAWSHHWIEWEVDYGEAPGDGEEGGSFDILLGCTNHGIVDNQYQFKVDVYVDGTKKGTLTITADSITERTGRMGLGKLDGAHTIRLVWTNDKWIPDQLDANIRYSSLKFLEQP